MSFIYLASPYSNHHATIREERYERVCAVAAHLMADKYEVVYSPIVHCHEIAQKHSLPKDFPFWRKINFGMLAKASKIFVLTLDGWEESVGVRAELDLAFSLSIPRFLIDEQTLNVYPYLESEQPQWVKSQWQPFSKQKT